MADIELNLHMPPLGTGRDGAASLRALVDRLQAARSGSAALDALIDDAMHNMQNVLQARQLGPLPRRGGARWSDELGAPVGLLTANYDFSVGQRDGICWAWVRPYDDWQPQEHEERHDHPDGSGLVVAYTAALALTSAVLLLGRFGLAPEK